MNTKKRFKIGIDIRPYIYDKSGMGQYVYNTAKSLIENDLDNDYILFSDIDFDFKFKRNYEKVIYNVSKIKILNTFFFHILSILNAKNKCDIYFSTSSLYIPALIKNFSIFVIHDLTIFKFPHLHKFKTKLLIKLFLPLALKNAKNIIAVSESTKADLLKIFPKTDKEKIFVIYQGVNQDLLEEVNGKNWNNIKMKFNINFNDYLLYIGSIEPRKNIISIIKTFEDVYKNTKNIGLVIAGKKGWGYAEIKNYIENIKDQDLKNHIIITGYITENEKANLYKYSKIFIYPSLYEGFGIPLLEAMLFKIPFITSNISSMPEVAGNAGILINPSNQEELKNSIMNLLENNMLYNDLQKEEEVQLKKFDWKKIVLDIVKIYK